MAMVWAPSPLQTLRANAGAGQVPTWKDDICSTFVDLDCEKVDPECFFGEVVSCQCADLQFSIVTSTRQRVLRTRSRISRSAENCLLLSLQLLGSGVVRQGRREAFQSPGDITLYDTTEPYELCFDDEFRQFIVKIPRQQLQARIGAPESVTAITFSHSHGPVRLAARYLTELANECLEVPAAMRRMANSTALDAVALAMSTQRVAGHAAPQGNSRSLTLQRVLYYIRDHLADPTLSPRSISQAHGISVRYLSSMFESLPLSVDRTIWQQRVERCARDLSDSAKRGNSITDIALSWGFSDSAHFSRSFRARYGVSPREYRWNSTAGK